MKNVTMFMKTYMDRAGSVLEHVQNRDRIKLTEINKAGYRAYVIKDMGSHNPEFVKEEFKKFLRWIS